MKLIVPTFLVRVTLQNNGWRLELLMLVRKTTGWRSSVRPGASRKQNGWQRLLPAV